MPKKHTPKKCTPKVPLENLVIAYERELARWELWALDLRAVARRDPAEALRRLRGSRGRGIRFDRERVLTTYAALVHAVGGYDVDGLEAAQRHRAERIAAGQKDDLGYRVPMPEQQTPVDAVRFLGGKDGFPASAMALRDFLYDERKEALEKRHAGKLEDRWAWIADLPVPTARELST